MLEFKRVTEITEGMVIKYKSFKKELCLQQYSSFDLEKIEDLKAYLSQRIIVFRNENCVGEISISSALGAPGVFLYLNDKHSAKGFMSSSDVRFLMNTTSTVTPKFLVTNCKEVWFDNHKLIDSYNSKVTMSLNVSKHTPKVLSSSNKIRVQIYNSRDKKFISIYPIITDLWLQGKIEYFIDINLGSSNQSLDSIQILKPSSNQYKYEFAVAYKNEVLIGFSYLFYDQTNTTNGYQRFTYVSPSERGNKISLELKTALYNHILDKNVKNIITSTFSNNKSMLYLNNAMNFKAVFYDNYFSLG
jgi:hypothetical protein